MRSDAPTGRIEWMQQDEHGGIKQDVNTYNKTGEEDGEPLVGNFVDAAAAMR
jgi:hypothetical protein